MVSMFSCSSNSFSLIVLISAEKYLSVCYPFWYENYVTKRRVCFACVTAALTRGTMPFIFITFPHFLTHLLLLWDLLPLLSFPGVKKKSFSHFIELGMIIITFSVILCYYVPTIYGVHSSIFGWSQVCTAMARRPFCVRHIQN